MHQKTSSISTPFLQRLLRRILQALPWKASLDPSSIFNFGLVLFALLTSFRSASRLISGYAQDTCLSTVLIKKDDPIYHDVLLWMEDHQFVHRNFRSVVAKTSNPNALGKKGEIVRATTTEQNASFNPNEIVSYRLQDNNTSIQLRPFQGSHLFRFNGRWILFHHNNQSHENRTPDQGEKSHIKLQCVSLALEPLRVFIEAAREHRRKVSLSTTSIFRAMSTPYRDYSRWSRIATRPSRDISTVIFDAHKKDAILRDINEYLHPQTKRWYANHGIPYRRGYLFSGPPGTGKTSLASAIAGVFGLDIYVLSLLDPSVTESQFVRLFTEVPVRCIVLLEDIDVAGLNRPVSPPPKPEFGQKPTTAPTNTGVSLSGLLNAIDGVSSHEGRILIMTTNAPENLDRALIRPGRVDMRVDFDLPAREELRGLFLSMYNEISHQGPMGTRNLETLATEFVDKLPAKKFSLAEVQGFLLRYKQRPEDARDKVAEWLEEIQETQESSETVDTEKEPQQEESG